MDPRIVTARPPKEPPELARLYNGDREPKFLQRLRGGAATATRLTDLAYRLRAPSQPWCMSVGMASRHAAVASASATSNAPLAMRRSPIATPTTRTGIPAAAACPQTAAVFGLSTLQTTTDAG